eukprot:GEZU01018765.1.p2 GENE.GEZU01018765.1~~GEZU01018765.1.p2  ORF type:complete len:340 (-),score=136.06 GEZU01018765.1:31-1050(-)
MLEVNWNASKGWDTPKIVPFHDLTLPPSCSSLHYAIQCFEGMKAYKDAEGNIRLFRPDMNARRLNASAARLALPQFDQKEFLECLSELIRVDKDWIPTQEGYSLYIRPTIISTERTLGVAPAKNALLFVILSPVGPYYRSGFNPVKLLADPRYVRAFPGGTGASKIGANYGPTIFPQSNASKLGYNQVMWLYGPNHQIAEVGTMNMFFFIKNKSTGKPELITPRLDGTILPGVTRDSILTLAREWNEFDVHERDFTMPELIEALKEDRVIEAFGAGTAAIVSPVEAINFNGEEHKIPLDKDDPNAKVGKLASRFMNHLLGIQYGRIPHPWSVVIDKASK